MPFDAQGQKDRSVGGDPTLTGDWKGDFINTIEQRIVPELLSLTGAELRAISGNDPMLIEAIADAAVCGEPEVVTAHVMSFTAKGRGLEDALLELIGPAARRLGEDWENDTRDFLEVTIGLGTLQDVLRSITGQFQIQPLPDHSILLGPTPGEDHTLGLAIVDHFFRMARWRVDFRPFADRQTLVDAVRHNWYAVIGLSLSGETLIEEAATTLGIVRRASNNRGVRILVGGPAFSGQRELATYIGADSLAEDAADAVEIAGRWITETGRARAR